MADENSDQDRNFRNSLIVAASDGSGTIRLVADKTTKRLLVDVPTVTVAGGAADGAAVSGNPVLIAGSDGTNARTLNVTTTGNLLIGTGAAGADDSTNTVSFIRSSGSVLGVGPYWFDGSTWDRARGDSANGLLVNLGGSSNPSIDSFTQAAINLTTGANQVLVSSSASKQIWVYGIVYTCSVAGTVSFQDEDDTAITGIMDHAANSGLSHPASGNFAMPIWKLATNKDLEVDVVTANIDGWLDYSIVSV